MEKEIEKRMNRQKKEKPGNTNEKRFGKYFLLAGLAVIIPAICYLVPDIHKNLLHLIEMFETGDFTVLRDFVASYGNYAAAVSFFLMILQSVAAPLPAFLLTFANASLFGWWKGAILSWSSAMAGAAVCFYIARFLGRDLTEKLASKAGLEQIEDFFARYGKNTVLICRLLPFVSFDLVSYAAGLTPMSFGAFFLATGIGQLPATLVYSYIGNMLTGGTKIMITGLMILFAISALIFLIKQIYTDRKKKN